MINPIRIARWATRERTETEGAKLVVISRARYVALLEIAAGYAEMRAFDAMRGPVPYERVEEVSERVEAAFEVLLTRGLT